MGQVSNSKYTVMASWQDVPHLTETAKADLLASTMPFQRESRSKGIPSMGAGSIYPVSYEENMVEPFIIPPFWKRGYGLDVGWNRTAGIWLAQNPLDSSFVVYAEHYRGEAVPTIHAASIKARGAWIQGAIDPAAHGRGQIDGQKLFELYAGIGLNIVKADNAVTEGIYKVWSLLEFGQIKFFNTLRYLPAEYRLYHRDEKGVIVKKNDHLMDALRYAIATWDAIGSVRPTKDYQMTGTGIVDSNAGY